MRIMNKLNNKIKIAGLCIFAVISITACGGGGGSSASFSNAENKIDINVSCVTNPTATNISNYITLLSGDTIVKEENNTTVSIYHDINGTKKICKVGTTGSAYILRN